MRDAGEPDATESRTLYAQPRELALTIGGGVDSAKHLQAPGQSNRACSTSCPQ